MLASVSSGEARRRLVDGVARPRRGRPAPAGDQRLHAGPAGAGQGPAEPAPRPPRSSRRRRCGRPAPSFAAPTGGRWRSATACSRGSGAAPTRRPSTPGTASWPSGPSRWSRRARDAAAELERAVRRRGRDARPRGRRRASPTGRGPGTSTLEGILAELAARRDGRPRARLHRLRAAPRRGRDLVRRPLAAPLRLAGPAAARPAGAPLRRARGAAGRRAASCR